MHVLYNQFTSGKVLLVLNGGLNEAHITQGTWNETICNWNIYTRNIHITRIHIFYIYIVEVACKQMWWCLNLYMHITKRRAQSLVYTRDKSLGCCIYTESILITKGLTTAAGFRTIHIHRDIPISQTYCLLRYHALHRHK